MGEVALSALLDFGLLCVFCVQFFEGICNNLSVSNLVASPFRHQSSTVLTVRIITTSLKPISNYNHTIHRCFISLSLFERLPKHYS